MSFVAIHELGHVITVSIGHTQEFWDNFKWLLEICEKEGIYKSTDYSKYPQEYCGMKITDNPLLS